MENQHRKISGYRELSQEEIDLMNEIKALGPQIETVIKKVKKHHLIQRKRISGMAVDQLTAEVDRLELATPELFLALAKTDMQTGLMYMTRSVAQPTFF
jgi:SMC interacting uncharacterized protein involved in chromosome segregation